MLPNATNKELVQHSGQIIGKLNKELAEASFWQITAQSYNPTMLAGNGGGDVWEDGTL